MVRAAVLGVTKVTGQGQVTIPKEVREKMTVKAGDWMQFLLTEDGHMVIRKFEFDIELAMKSLSKIITSKDSKLS
ncbi:MAG: AbrB/MazE/SpoVT family DNA-binding domain-containing protein [Thaumarchaeota archaeon]|nr:MAG: AbrB/MazE/SpoVT family DNA-binding domain-containing protein [Nitrososphaerota archaeon]